MIHPQNRGREHQVVLTSHPTAGRCCAQRIGQKQATDTRVDTPSSLYRAWRISGATTQIQHNKKTQKWARNGGDYTTTQRHRATTRFTAKKHLFSKHIGPHCKASGHRASTATTTTSTARCQTARRFPSHPRSSTNQPIIAAANTIVATTKPTEQRSPPSVTPSSSTEISSPSATDAVPTKLRN